MKPFHILFPLVFLFASCVPAVPAPTATVIPPTLTNTAAPTATETPEPTATLTPEPTKGPMPNGWMSIAETKEIGGRQVVVNDKGEGATQIDGEWYPVDIKGCYYKEFFDPANQTDPKIGAIVRKINSEPAMNYEFGDHDWRRNSGTIWMAYPEKGSYPRYSEKHFDAVLLDQRLCLNESSMEWEHVLDHIQSYFDDLMPENTKVMRSTVGWLRDGRYLSFTYKQKGQESKKATSIDEAFNLWGDLVNSHEQIVIGIPLHFTVNNLGHWPEKEYEPAIQKLVIEAPKRHPEMWNSNFSDPEFIKWALSEKNQMRYWGNKKNWYTYCRNDNKWTRTNLHRCHGEQASEGKFPNIVARIVYVR